MLLICKIHENSDETFPKEKIGKCTVVLQTFFSSNALFIKVSASDGCHFALLE